uniref:Uncharacterized protein n=1 Tax=Anguilla anguilla TaxID=7936 RepID=A0A0E9WWV1_ANGAN
MKVSIFNLLHLTLFILYGNSLYYGFQWACFVNETIMFKVTCIQLMGQSVFTRGPQLLPLVFLLFNFHLCLLIYLIFKYSYCTVFVLSLK